MDTTDELTQALHLADVADKITRKYYLSGDLHTQTKPDNTPVTEADKAVEAALSLIVSEEYGEQFVGEEGTRTGNPDSPRSWIVDPIDGTRNFMRGMPVWATLIAQRENGQVITAVASAPALGRRWWAAKGKGAWTQDVDGTVRRLRVSKVAKLEDAFLLISSLYNWDEVPTGSAGILKLMKEVWRERALGDFLSYMLLAEGAADACAEPNMKEWDIAAPSLILTEAGGSVWTAATPDTPPSAPRIVVATNGLLEKDMLSRLALS